MNFEECINQGKLIETGDRDLHKAREIFNSANHKLKFWKEVEKKSKPYPSVFIEGHYEIIKELSTILLILDGWKSENHDCLFQYLSEKKQDLEIDFEFLSELRTIRNKIDYEGIKVSYETWKNNELRLNLTIKRIIEYIKPKLQ